MNMSVYVSAVVIYGVSFLCSQFFACLIDRVEAQVSGMDASTGHKVCPPSPPPLNQHLRLTSTECSNDPSTVPVEYCRLVYL